MIDRRIEQFSSGDFMLTGQWDGPVNPPAGEKLPGIIVCHGFTGNRMESRRMFPMLTRRLAMRGCACFRFDHRGCGDSEGDFRDFTRDGLLEDLRAALGVFEGNSAIDPNRTAVLGYSLGGLSASFLLSQRPSFVTAVFWAAVAQPDVIRDRLAAYPDFPNYQTKGFFDYGGIRVSREYIDKIGELNPVEWATTFPKPALFIQGGLDPIVKPHQVELYLEGRANEEDKLVMIPDGDHAFGSADNVDLVISESEQWLANALIL